MVQIERESHEAGESAVSRSSCEPNRNVLKYTAAVKNTNTSTMTVDNINPALLAFKAMEYAARGPVILRTLEIEKELLLGVQKPFQEVVKANLGDAHAMGQKPVTFLRQVVAAVTCPDLAENSSLPGDVKQRAARLLDTCRGTSIGSYTDSRGLEVIRRHVAEFITERDGGIESSADNILLSAGASDGIRACLKLLKSGESGRKSGVMVPIPEYPLYNATLGEYEMMQIGYYLDESQGWAVNIEELERSISEARKNCSPRAIVVINPGNPTGHVLSRENIEEVIEFAHREKLVIFADEVYQENVYGQSEFHSFKKTMMEMKAPFNSVELFSFFSCSKGYVCECGIRGAYTETTNIDTGVKSVLSASIAAKLCPTILGQVAVDCVVNPPKPGDESYETFTKEKAAILESLEKKAKLAETAFNALPQMSCSEIQGAMYAYPQVKLPEKAILVSKSKDMEPDVFYALELLESTGICVVPGAGIGQVPGTYHFRTTILPTLDKLEYMLQRFSEFHLKFLEKYSS